MANKHKKLTVFSEATATEIAAFVKGELATEPTATNQIGGRAVSKTTTLAEITSVTVTSGVARHAWIEVRWNQTDEEFEDTPDGRSGTVADNFAIALPDPEIPITVGAIVQMIRLDDPETQVGVWLALTPSFGIGKYQGQVAQMLAQHVAGWDYPTLHGV